MMITFQITRKARLGLAHQITRNEEGLEFGMIIHSVCSVHSVVLILIYHREHGLHGMKRVIGYRNKENILCVMCNPWFRFF